jgi:hypothetical protein
MNDYLTFDKFITPVIIQILFWLGLAGIVILALWMIVSGLPGGGVMGLIYLLLGPIFWRVYMELLLVMFKIHAELHLIRKQGESRP